MHPPCPIVLMLALLTIVAARSSNVRGTSYLEALERRINNYNKKYMENNLVLRDTVEDCTVRGEQNVIQFTLKKPSASGDSAQISVPLPDGSGICLKGSSGRGVGTVFSNKCNANEEENGALCYPKCRDDNQAVGCCLCRKKGFPSTYTDDGVATCMKPAAYGRGSGYAWRFGDGFNSRGMLRRCEADNGAGNCQEVGAIVYPKCRSNFQNVGCCICSPSCPDGMSDLGISCEKSSYSRGGGMSRLGCADDKEQDAALCYKKCPNGWYGKGPVCWQSCPNSTPYDCGVMCTVDQSQCVQITASIAVAAVNIGVDLAEMNSEGIMESINESATIVTDVMSNPYC